MEILESPIGEDVDPGFASGLSSETTVGAVIEDYARRAGDRPSIVGTQIGEVSYRSLVRQVTKLRDEFRNAGIGSRARIGLMLPSGVEAAVATVAAASHATCVPFHPAISKEELARELERLPLDAVMAPEWLETPALEVVKDRSCALFAVKKVDADFERFGVRCLRAAAAKATDFAGPASASETLVLRTSATTGLPKLVPSTHGNMIEGARKMHRWIGVSASDRAASILPTYYAQGCQTGILIPLLLGGSVAIPNAGQFDSRGQWIADLAPTWFSAGPTFLLNLVDALQSRGGERLRHSLRFVLCASAHLPARIRESVEAALEVPVLEFYGMSECGMIAANSPPPRLHKPGTAGRIPVGELEVRDDEGNVAQPGQFGEIFVSGPSVMPGYIIDDGPARFGLRDGWLPTGDLGSIDEDGFLTISGRLKEVINRGGEKISPVEIEAVMLRHPDVREAAAFGVPHPRLGENVSMAVVLRSGAQATASDLGQFLRQRLPPFKTPRRIDIMDALPKGNTGKVLRKSLSELASRRERHYAEPEEPLAVTISEIWRRLLKVDQIGVDDDFFEAGGDSLLAERMLLEVESAVDHQISVSALSEASTIRGLVAVAASKSGSDNQLLTKVRGGPGVPFFFCHGDFGSRGFYALKLAQLIDPPQPIYLLQALRNVDETSDLSIEAMARLYVPLLLAAKPEGPFRLGGYCNGGLLATAIAKQLMSSGYAVELVMLIESVSINCFWPLRLARQGLRALAAIVPSGRFRIELVKDGMLSVWNNIIAMYRIFRVFASVLDDGLLSLVKRIARRARRSSSSRGNPVRNENDAIESVYLRAMANYIPPRLDCEIVAIYADTQVNISHPLWRHRFWKSRMSNVRYFEVPGDHFSCITTQAATLATCIGAVLARSGASGKLSGQLAPGDRSPPVAAR